MDYEFLVRTADNVEIILDVSIFWQITDLYKLVLVTQDPPEDICTFSFDFPPVKKQTNFSPFLLDR